MEGLKVEPKEKESIPLVSRRKSPCDAPRHFNPLGTTITHAQALRQKQKGTPLCVATRKIEMGAHILFWKDVVLPQRQGAPLF